MSARSQLRYISTGIALLAALVFFAGADAAWAQRFGFGGPPPGDRIFGFLDRDGDGRVSSDEIDQAPGPMREFLRNNDSFGRSLDREEFNRLAPQMFQGFRGPDGGPPGDFGRGSPGDFGRGDYGRGFGFGEYRREEGGDVGRGGWFDRGRDFDRRDDSRGSSSSRSSAPKPKTSVTVKLPEAYAARDKDGDGQIGLYEWLQDADRTALAQFEQLDANGDGFATPRELVQYDASQKAQQPAKPQQPAARLVVVGPSQGDSRSSGSESGRSNDDGNRDRNRNPDGGEERRSSDEQNPAVRRAEYYFQSLDRNRDGTLTPDEWASSQRLRPMFEAAGIDLSRPMSREQFVEHSVRLSGEG